VNFNGRASTPKSCDVVKKYYYYVNDDHDHDTLFVQHYITLIYELFINNRIISTKD
jgi:hypothetical protein